MTTTKERGYDLLEDYYSTEIGSFDRAPVVFPPIWERERDDFPAFFVWFNSLMSLMPHLNPGDEEPDDINSLVWGEDFEEEEADEDHEESEVPQIWYQDLDHEEIFDLTPSPDSIENIPHDFTEIFDEETEEEEAFEIFYDIESPYEIVKPPMFFYELFGYVFTSIKVFLNKFQ